VQEIEPEDGDKKVDEHDGCDEDVDREHCHHQPWLPRAALDTRVSQIHGPVAAAAVNVA